MKKVNRLFVTILAIVFVLAFAKMSVADFQKSFLLSKNLKITSYEPSINNKYPLYNMLDYNPDNTFVYNSSENIRLDFEARRNENILYFYIVNGYAKNNNIYYANNIITRIKVTDGQKVIKIYPLIETLAPQKILLPKAYKKISIIVDAIKKGTNYNDTCISSLKFFNSANKDILEDNLYFVFRSADNYPDYILVDRKDGLLNIYKDYPSEHDISPIDFSPDGTKFYFFGGETENYGLFMYDFIKRKDKKILKGKAITKVNWINDNRIVVDWMVIDGEKRTNGQSILSLKDFN